MIKVLNWLEAIKIDINEDESIILSHFHKMLQINFKLILLFGIPLLVYMVIASQTLG